MRWRQVYAPAYMDEDVRTSRNAYRIVLVDAVVSVQIGFAVPLSQHRALRITTIELDVHRRNSGSPE